MMQRKLFIIGCFIVTVTLLDAQTMIGLSKEEVSERVRNEYREFSRDVSVIRQYFNYLKYVNAIRTKTWIIYFTDEDICSSSKLVCDYNEMEEERERLNRQYSQESDTVWNYDTGSGIVQFELTTQEWYFTILETKKEEGDGNN